MKEGFGHRQSSLSLVAGCLFLQCLIGCRDAAEDDRQVASQPTTPQKTATAAGVTQTAAAKHSADDEQEIDLIIKRLEAGPDWMQLRPDSGIEDRQKCLDTLAFVAKHDVDQIRAALNKYLNVEAIRSEGALWAAIGNIYVLNRFLFAVPEKEERTQMNYVAGWKGVPETATSVAALWPLAESASAVYGFDIVGFHSGYAGDGYFPALAEFDKFRNKYGLRPPWGTSQTRGRR